MIDESCEVPREDLDDGFNPCRKQVVENGELRQYAHMYDVMNERYDREEDTSYLNSVKRDRITQSTPSQTVGEGKLYAQDGQGVEGFVKSSGTLDPTTHAEIPSSKAVAEYVSSQIPDISDLEAEIEGKLDGRYEGITSYEPIPTGYDLNTYTKPGVYGTDSTVIAESGSNHPNWQKGASFRLVVRVSTYGTDVLEQLLTTWDNHITWARTGVYANNEWNWTNYPWTLLYPTPSSTVPNPLPVDQGGTGAQTRSLKTAAGLTLLPVIDSIGASGALNGYTSVTNIATFITTNNIRPEITAAFENHIADAVADNDLLPTNALMIDYVDAHSMDTPPDKFSFKVSPFPSGTWEGEMNINVVPVFATTIGSVTYVVARVYGSKIFNYTGSADNINLFSSLKPVEEYTNAINNSTNIPLTLSVMGRSSTPGTYGFTPNGSTANLSLNNQIVSSVFYSGDFGISNNLKCVFGEGTNTPSVSVSVNCMALMWYSPM